MGFKISWLGFKGLDAAEVLSRLSMRDTGVWDEAREAPFSLAATGPDWLVLWSNDCGFVSGEVIEPLSKNATVVGCQIHEGIMYVAAMLYQDGRQVWSVVHDSDEGAHDLQIDGVPPESFEGIKAALWAEQIAHDAQDSPVDFIFDIPVALAQSMTGFRYDQWSIEGVEPRFHVAEPT